MKPFLKTVVLLPLAVLTLSWMQPMPNHLPPYTVTRYGAIPHTEPVLSFGGKRSGATLSVKALPNPAVLVPLTDKGNAFMRIEKFTVQLTGSQGTFTQTCTGNLVPADVLRRIRSASAGSRLHFKEVFCQPGDGSRRCLEASYLLQP